MNYIKHNDLVDSDIVDYNFANNPVNGVDLSGLGSQVYMPIPVFITEAKDRKGKRELTDLEVTFRDALCVESVRAFYLLQGLEYDAVLARALINEHLTSGVSFEKAIRYGRKACLNFTPFTRADDFERDCRERFKASKHKPSHSEITYHLQLLNRAHSRVRRMYAEIYNADRETNENRRHDGRLEALIFRQPTEKAPTLPECLTIAYCSGINPSWLWQGYWFYRLIFEASIRLGLVIRGFDTSITLLQAYVLFRMCGPERTGQEYHDGCKDITQQNVDLTVGMEKFMNAAKYVLDEAGLLECPPINANKLIEQYGEFDEPVMRLKARKL
jgi:hypothetical protein